jgi:arylamine N-acetyltransferase
MEFPQVNGLASKSALIPQVLLFLIIESLIQTRTNLFSVHALNIVTVVEGRYVSDVGFGGDGAILPLPLKDSIPQINLGTQEIQLAYTTLPHHPTHQKWWIYQYRNSRDVAWNSSYAFAETSWIKNDFDFCNYWVVNGEDSFQTFTVLIIKFLMNEERKIYGKRMLVNHEVKENLGGKTSVIRTYETDEARVAGLKELFGISLTDEEKEAIKGFKTEIGPLRIVSG